jgi:MOSC domain-containing protein
MPIKVGEVEALFRYPVKSMGGEPLEGADLGWHGLDGDRRLALRRVEDRGGFPWLTASRLPELILFAPQRRGPVVAGNLPTHVRTPEGEDLAVFGQELAAEIGRRHGSPVEMMHLNRGVFDEASISVITSATVGEIGRLAAQQPDVRRFRPNVLIASLRSVPFEEDEWVGGVLSFGESAEAAAIAITNRDERCSMVNFDPGSARAAPEVLKAIVRVRENKAGVYGTVMRRGRLTAGQPIYFEPAAGQRVA